MQAERSLPIRARPAQTSYPGNVLGFSCPDPVRANTSTSRRLFPPVSTSRNRFSLHQALSRPIEIPRKVRLSCLLRAFWAHSELGMAVRKVVTQLHLHAPAVVGLSVPDAEARLKDFEADMLGQLHTLGTATAKPIPASSSPSGDSP